MSLRCFSFDLQFTSVPENSPFFVDAISRETGRMLVTFVAGGNRVKLRIDNKFRFRVQTLNKRNSNKTVFSCGRLIWAASRD